MITVEITFSSDQDIVYPDSVDLEFTNEEVEKIERLIEIAKKEQVSIKYEVTQMETEEAEFDDFIPSLEFIQIFKDGDLCYEAQDDSSVVINSDFFTLNDIKNDIKVVR